MKKNKKLIIITACGIAAVIIGLFAYLMLSGTIFSNHVNRIISALEDQNYTEATTIFEQNRHDIDMAVLENALSGRLDNLRNEFINENIAFTSAKLEIETINNFALWRLENQAEDVERFIEMLNDSRVAFQVAGTLYAQGDFLGAIENFRVVSIEDSNYDAARDGLVRGIEGYRQNALARAATYVEDENFAQAILVLDNALEIVGNETELATQREVYARQEVEIRIGSAQALVAANNFAGAMDELRLLDAQFSNNAEVAHAMATVETDHVNFIVGRVSGFVAQYRFDDAMQEINDGLRIHAGNAVLIAARTNAEDAHVNNVITQAIGHADAGNYVAALTLLNNAQRTYAGNAALANAVREIDEREIESILAQAAEYVAERRFTDAILFLQNSRRVGDWQIVEQIEEYASFQPISLWEIPAFEGNGLRIVTANMLGNAYANALASVRIFDWSAANDWGRRNLDGKFTTITGIIGRLDGSSSRDSSIVFIGDGRQIASFTVSGSTLPTEVSIDVRGINILEIRIDEPSNGVRVVFADAMIYP